MKLTKEKTMEAIYLQSMTDFVLKVVQTPNINEAVCWEQTEGRLNKIYQYSLFLKQPLKLGFFVPCDSIGRLVESIGAEEWDNAKKNVLFNGFVFKESQKEALKNNTQLSVSIYTENSFYITHRLNGKWHTWFGLKTVEDLIKCKIELSKTAIKQIGL